MTQNRVDLLVQMLTCADSFICLDSCDHAPEPEPGTGRVLHTLTPDGVVLHFEDCDITVTFQRST